MFPDLVMASFALRELFFTLFEECINIGLFLYRPFSQIVYPLVIFASEDCILLSSVMISAESTIVIVGLSRVVFLDWPNVS